MKRPIVLHGLDRELLCRFGAALGGRFGVPFIDLFGRGTEELAGSVRSSALQVVVVSSETMLDRAWRVECLATATVVALGASLGGSGWGVATTRMTELVAAEFREAHASFSGTEEAGAIVDAIVGLAERNPIGVALGDASYLVEVGRGVLEARLAQVDFKSSVLLYLTDQNVQRLHGGRLQAAVRATGLRAVEKVLVPGEETKCLGTLAEVFDAALAGGVDRSSWLVAAGGGVITDIGGLVAALWMRGLRWLGISTTLLGMVDASVGGKTAVDHGMGKNAVGAFWQPSRVVCDVEFLRTESERNYVGALSEVVKTALIGDVGLLELIWSERCAVLARDLDLLVEVVRRCVQVKARIVGLDPKESGLRAVLNLGHTLGHALEALGEYRRYTHGEAVSLGLVLALRVGVRLGYTPMDLAARIREMLVALGLPVNVEAAEVRAAAELLGHDKKRAGSAIRFVVARAAGEVTCERIGLEDLRELVESLD